jgi:Tfp pilus assembly protein PilF
MKNTSTIRTSFKQSAVLTLTLTLPMLTGCSLRNAVQHTDPSGTVSLTSVEPLTSIPSRPREEPETAALFCQTAAEEYASAGQTTQAIALFEQAQHLDADLADSNSHRLAVLQAEAGDADRARILFEQAIVASPNNADLHNDYGFFLLTQGEAEQARNHFQTALNLKPDHARATMNLGLLAARAGDHATAESRFALIVGTTAARENVAKIAGQRQLQGSRH